MSIYANIKDWNIFIVSSFVEYDWQHKPHPYHLNNSTASLFSNEVWILTMMIQVPSLFVLSITIGTYEWFLAS